MAKKVEVEIVDLGAHNIGTPEGRDALMHALLERAEELAKMGTETDDGPVGPIPPMNALGGMRNVRARIGVGCMVALAGGDKEKSKEHSDAFTAHMNAVDSAAYGPHPRADSCLTWDAHRAALRATLGYCLALLDGAPPPSSPGPPPGDAFNRAEVVRAADDLKRFRDLPCDTNPDDPCDQCRRANLIAGQVAAGLNWVLGRDYGFETQLRQIREGLAAVKKSTHGGLPDAPPAG